MIRRHRASGLALVALLALGLGGCPPRTKATPKKQPDAEPARKDRDRPERRHGSHEHGHGPHPHPRDDHHHHPHPHPHLDGPDGHHHPY